MINTWKQAAEAGTRSSLLLTTYYFADARWTEYPWKTAFVDITSDRTLYARVQHTNTPFSQPFTASPGHEAMHMDLCTSQELLLSLTRRLVGMMSGRICNGNILLALDRPSGSKRKGIVRTFSCKSRSHPHHYAGVQIGGFSQWHRPFSHIH